MRVFLKTMHFSIKEHPWQKDKISICPSALGSLVNRHGNYYLCTKLPRHVKFSSSKMLL